MTDDELDLIDRLAASAGLVKVWDGTEWRDLRVVVKHLCAHIRDVQGRCAALEERTAVLLAEHERVLGTLDEAHAEIATLGTLLRGDDA